MEIRIDLTGKVFGHLTVLGFHEKKNGSQYWLCKCDCGKTVIIQRSNMTSGTTKSCGCMKGFKHGFYGHPVYKAFYRMKDRCSNPHNKSFSRYGGRGITVCSEWSDVATFAAWALASGWKQGLTLDRVDPNGNYEPSNCRWISLEAQQRNRTNTKKVIWEGNEVALTVLCEQKGIDYKKVHNRMTKLGWSLGRALAA
ncbi:MAG: hypothetical protein A4E65_00339 [Syntrophorhabdus sp. PtaU1.Bin153]|nr:MAG: hypothetical protein A4E65_00339 [Syntrophorhabdus sp. PtaU1.Bin153]